MGFSRFSSVIAGAKLVVIQIAMVETTKRFFSLIKI